MTVVRGNGDGSFQAGMDYATGADPQSVAIADLNGDGNRDLVTANQTDGTVSVLRGTATRASSPRSTSRPGRAPAAVAIGDMNGDGIPDLVVANTAGTSILLGQGSLKFAPKADFTAGTNPV